MTRRSQREIERAIDRLDDEAADDGTAPRVPSQFVHFDGSVEVLEEGPDDEPTTFDVVLTDDAGEVVEPDADDAEDGDDAGADDEATGRRESDGSDGPTEDPERDGGCATDGVEGEDTDDEAEPIEVTRMTRLRRRRLAESGGRRGGARYGPGRWRP